MNRTTSAKKAGLVLLVLIILAGLVLEDAWARSSMKRGQATVSRSAKRASISRSRRQVNSRSRRIRTASRSAGRRTRRGRTVAGRGTTASRSRLKTGHAHPDVSHEPKTGPEFEESSSKLTQIYSLYDQGTNQRILGDPQGALAHLRQAASLARAYYSRGYNNKNSSLEQVIHYDLGQAAEKARDLDQALEAYLYCLQLSPGNLDAAGRVVSILVQKGQLQAALRVAQNAVSAHPEDARARAFLAGVLTKMGNGTEASQEAEKSSQILKDTGELSPDETGSRESDPTKPKSEEPTPGL